MMFAKFGLAKKRAAALSTGPLQNNESAFLSFPLERPPEPCERRRREEIRKLCWPAPTQQQQQQPYLKGLFLSSDRAARCKRTARDFSRLGQKSRSEKRKENNNKIKTTKDGQKMNKTFHSGSSLYNSQFFSNNITRLYSTQGALWGESSELERNARWCAGCACRRLYICGW